MEKPEKKEEFYVTDIGYNRAIDDYEAYHNHVMSELPDAEEIYSLIDPCIVSRRQIAKAIARRIGKE